MHLEDTRVVAAALEPRLRAALNLEDWLINILYDGDEILIEPGVVQTVTQAHMYVNGEYMHATIIIFYKNIEDEARLRLALVHEFIHITQWPFFNYSYVIGRLLPTTQREAHFVAWTHAVERQVQEVMRWPRIKALYTDTEEVTSRQRGKGAGGSARRVKS